MTRQIILACSATKRHVDVRTPLAAVARYDGPAWRTYRKRRTCAILPGFALSAEYGLISEYDEITHYDRRMTAERAAFLLKQTAAALIRHARSGALSDEILFFGGALYRDTLRQAIAAAAIAPDRFHFTQGGIGTQLGQLKAFIEGATQ